MSEFFIHRATGKVFESPIPIAVAWTGSAAMRIFKSVDTGVWFTATAQEFDEQFDSYVQPSGHL